MKQSTRRQFLQQSGLLFGGTLLAKNFAAQASPGPDNPLPANAIGKWVKTANGLPAFQYTGALPFMASTAKGGDAQLPDDPYFLLGNYRLSLFVHASGIVQLMTGERAWARINAAEKNNYGVNSAQLAIGSGNKKKTHELIGLSSVAAETGKVKKVFGTGFAHYHYSLENEMECSRVLSVKPSLHINTGNAAFVTVITLTNNSRDTKAFLYTEGMQLNYTPCALQFAAPEKRPMLYTSKPAPVQKDSRVAVANIDCKTNGFLPVPSKDERFIYDINPPAVFTGAYAANSQTKAITQMKDGQLSARFSGLLKPQQSQSFYMITGISYGDAVADVAQQHKEVASLHSLTSTEGIWLKEWKEKLPGFDTEQDEDIRQELTWNAYTLEAMATYCAYYRQTIVPQGTVYAYHFGDNISNRDHLQAALPLCYYNAPLAKSIIRYVIMHSEADGEIKRGDAGYGYTPPSIYQESDEQLYFFQAVAQYLGTTKDHAFLNETVPLYPAENKKNETLLNILEKYFIYLRDVVGTGPDGLVKMLHSDWSDSFFHTHSPDVLMHVSQSHLNTAMALAIFPALINALKAADNKKAAPLIEALQTYHDKISTAFFADLGDRKFSARAYLNQDLKFGLDNVCLEPQGYLLQIPSLSASRKKEIYDYVKSKLAASEKIGFRTREKPLWKGQPEGEDGGIWPSLTGALLIGVISFDKEEAKELLKMISLKNFAQQYPDYWVGQWTGPDNLNSTLSVREGLYAFWEDDIKNSFPAYCCHVHAWPLYAYLKLHDERNF